MLVLALSACYALFGCASKVDKGFYGPSQPKYRVEMDGEGRKHGREVWWYANGKKKFEGVYKKGVRDGIYTAWYEDGSKWYEGYEKLGIPESTLTYWHPNGQLKSVTLFKDGAQADKQEYDTAGRLLGPDGLPVDLPEDALPATDTLAAARTRDSMIKIWAVRVRQTVEGYWQLPKRFQKEAPLRAVAHVVVARDGRLMRVELSTKSESSAFNSLALSTFKKIKKLPAFSAEIMEDSLEIEYEFLSQGKMQLRKKLELRGEEP